ncbi:hypothetical protein AWENTII_003041 [Aspergillus wentii]
MEYCPLGDIANCYNNPLPESVTRNVGRQVLEGLAKLHEIGIIHRDIKPQNILVLQKDPIWVKISDFGISKRVLDGQTELRTRAGTEGYVAPEVFGLVDDCAESSAYTSAVDIWSLGCLLHYLLTKSPPFMTLAALRDYCWDPMEFPEEFLIAEDVGDSGRKFIKDLLTLEPENRPKTSVDILSKWQIKKTAPKPTRRVPTEESWDGSEETFVHADLTNLDDNMDYHSLELWNATNNNIDIDRVTALLELSANPNKLCKGYTALHLSARNGSAEQVELLLDYGGDISFRTRPYEETALHLAMHQRSVDKLKMLIDRGADINAQNADGDTVLHLAITKGCSIDTLDLLIARGVNAELQGRYGRTALQYAITLDREDTARFLLQKGAKPNNQDYDGRSPLHSAIAATRVSSSFISMLIKAGADVNQRDSKGLTPLHEAVRLSRGNTIAFLVDEGAAYQGLHPDVEKYVRWALLWKRPSKALSW